MQNFFISQNYDARSGTPLSFCVRWGRDTRSLCLFDTCDRRQWPTWMPLIGWFDVYRSENENAVYAFLFATEASGGPTEGCHVGPGVPPIAWQVGRGHCKRMRVFVLNLKLRGKRRESDFEPRRAPSSRVEGRRLSHRSVLHRHPLLDFLFTPSSAPRFRVNPRSDGGADRRGPAASLLPPALRLVLAGLFRPGHSCIVVSCLVRDGWFW